MKHPLQRAINRICRNKCRRLPEDKLTMENRSDFAIIEELVPGASKVLDLGCGDGDLMYKLNQSKDIVARGVEISESGVAACISKGLSVFQGNIDEGLADYKARSFDYVISSRTVQAVFYPREAVLEMLRVGRKVIISFPNFGHFRNRLDLLFTGKMPKHRLLPYEWYDTPNIHHLTIRDFRQLCHSIGATIEKEIFIPSLTMHPTLLTRLWPNMMAHYGLFIISKNPDKQ